MNAYIVISFVLLAHADGDTAKAVKAIEALRGTITRVDGQIVEVDLNNRGLTEVPTELNAFRQLKVLNLSGNKCSDRGLAGLTTLTSLREINLQGNAFSDEGVKALGGLTDLEVVDLSENQISDKGLTRLRLRPTSRLVCG